MSLAIFMVGIFCLTIGIVIGRSDRRRYRKPTSLIKPARLYIAWRNPDSTRKS